MGFLGITRDWFVVLGYELACVAIVAVYYVIQWRRAHQPLRFLERILSLSAASWLVEHTVIETYGFYSYSPEWDGFVGHVPIFIIMIWPVVIHSSWGLARYALGEKSSWIPLLAGFFVLMDASLIEPISVHGEFWWWHEPGMFSVPPIGILGWALFAVGAVWTLEMEERKAGSTAVRGLRVGGLLGSVVVTHGLLLAIWWGLLRWVNQELNIIAVIVVTWCVTSTFAVWAWRKGLRFQIPIAELLLRIPGALFFLVVLLIIPPSWELIVYALAFPAPYLVLIAGKTSFEH